jgi:hypothetical protein
MIRERLWTGTWWRYRPGDPSAFSLPYHVFNLFEGGAWVLFSILVLIRCVRKSRSRLELGYALAFFTFGLTDFREAYVLSSWLVWVKLVNLIWLAWLRNQVIRRFYPENRLY